MSGLFPGTLRKEGFRSEQPQDKKKVGPKWETSRIISDLIPIYIQETPFLEET